MVYCVFFFADGNDGLFPHIPPDAELTFDVTLLGFRPRSLWVKSLIQEPGVSEKPFYVPPGQGPTEINLQTTGQGSKEVTIT